MNPVPCGLVTTIVWFPFIILTGWCFRSTSFSTSSGASTRVNWLNDSILRWTIGFSDLRRISGICCTTLGFFDGLRRLLDLDRLDLDRLRFFLAPVWVGGVTVVTSVITSVVTSVITSVILFASL